MISINHDDNDNNKEVSKTKSYKETESRMRTNIRSDNEEIKWTMKVENKDSETK